MSDICKHDLLEAWVYETVSPEEAREMERHVVECRTCSDEAAWLRRERKMFDSRARATTTDHAAMWAKVAPQLKGGTVTPIRSRSATMFGGLVAAAAAVLCMVKLGESFMSHGNAVNSSLSPTPGAAMPEKAQAEAKHTDQRWAFDVGAHAQVMIDNPNGEITVVAGKSGAVTLRAVLDDDSKNGWHVDTKQDKGVVMTRVSCQGLRCGDAPEVTLTAEVPEDADLTMHAVAADLTVHQVRGHVVANTVDGDIELNSVGQVQAKSVSGDIALLGGTSVASKLESVSGDLSWKGKCGQGCELELVTVSGDIQLANTKDSSYRMHFQTVSGEAPTLVSDDDSHPGRPHVVVFNGGKGAITVKTVSGDFDYGAEHAQLEHSTRDDIEILAPSFGETGDVAVEVRKAFDEAKRELDDAKRQLDDAKGELGEKLGKRSFDEAKKALDEAKKSLDTKRGVLHAGAAAEGMKEAKQGLEEAKRALDEAKRALDGAQHPANEKK